ncbi:unnamed protein product [Coccothraustes coccothraustes]
MAGGATEQQQRELQLPACNVQNGACGPPHFGSYAVGRTAGLVSAALPLPAATATQAWLYSRHSAQLIIAVIMTFSSSQHSGVPLRPEVPVAIAPRLPDEHPGCPQKQSEPQFRAETASVAPAAAPHTALPLTTARHSVLRRAGRCWPRPPAQAIGRAPLRPPMGAGHAPTAGNRTWKVTIGGDG